MFTKETAITLVKSEEQFPVNFDDAWRWLEYSRKDAAKRNFEMSGFVKDVDYQLHTSVELRPQGGFNNRELIYLTIDCFTHWAMMSGTPMGKKVRLYFIEAEKELKQLKQAKVLDYSQAQKLTDLLDDDKKPVTL